MRTFLCILGILFIAAGSWRCSCECVGCCIVDGEKICQDPDFISKRECGQMDKNTDIQSDPDEKCWFECAD